MYICTTYEFSFAGLHCQYWFSWHDSVLLVLIDKLSSFPQELEADDIEDFCSLALYYESRTPQSFRQVVPYSQNHFIYLFLYLDKSYRSLIALILPVSFTYFVIFFT